MDWIAELAADSRRRLGVSDTPTEADLLRLIDLHGVTLICAPVGCPYCVHTERGAVIVAPLWMHGEGHTAALAHEVGHGLTRPGGGNLLRFLWPDNPRIERLAKLWDSRDEAYADRFAQAWHGRAAA